MKKLIVLSYVAIPLAAMAAKLVPFVVLTFLFSLPLGFGGGAIGGIFTFITLAAGLSSTIFGYFVSGFFPTGPTNLGNFVMGL
jgi:hypothetical protein